jgi:hypothetical protein
MSEVSKDPEVNFETKTLPLVEKLPGRDPEQLNGKFTYAQLAQLANAILSGNEKFWNEFQDKKSDKICGAKNFSKEVNLLLENPNLTPEKLEQFWKTRLQIALVLNPNRAKDIQDFPNSYSWENDKFELKQLGQVVKKFIERNRGHTDCIIDEETGEKEWFTGREVISEILDLKVSDELLSRPHLDKAKTDETIINTRSRATCLAQLSREIREIRNLKAIGSKKVVAFINSTKYPVLNKIFNHAAYNGRLNETTLSKKEFDALEQEWMSLVNKVYQSVNGKPIVCNVEPGFEACVF